MEAEDDKVEVGQVLRYCMFVVDETPYCIWDTHLPVRNNSFINNINPGYFDYLAQVNSQYLDDDRYRYSASISLRSGYYQGLETLFALLGASLQAPRCTFAWMHKYTNGGLRDFVAKLQAGEQIKTRFSLDPVTWESVSGLVHSPTTIGEEEKLDSSKLFAELWEHFAFDFLRNANVNEYNSIKHGIRLGLGGSGLAFGGHDFGASEFGSNSLNVKKIDGLNQHLTFSHQIVNWEPDYLLIALQTIGVSLNNIKLFLQIQNGIASEDADQFKIINSRELIGTMLKAYRRTTVAEIKIKQEITKEHITSFTNDEIISSYG